MTVLLLLSSTVPPERPVGAAGGHRGVVEGVVGVSIAQLRCGAMAVGVGALARVAGLAPALGGVLRGEQVQGAVGAVEGQLLLLF